MAEPTLQQAFETAVARLQSGRPDEAAAICRQILAVQRHDAPLQMLGLLAGQAGKLEEAVEWIRQAIAVNPSVPAYYNNLGEACRRLGKLEQAVAAYRKAVELAPQYARPWQSLGKLFAEMGRSVEAVGACKAAADIEPGVAENHETLSAAHAANGDPEAAAASAAVATQLDPRRATSHSNLGGALLQLGRPAEAAIALRAAIRVDPELALAHWNLGLALLVQGDWEAGWPEYEWRLKCESLRTDRRFAQPRWNGEDLAGRTILLHAEQGMGDMLQFVRYAPIVAERGGTVLLECHPALTGLLRRAAGVAEVIPGGQPLPRFDVHCPLLSVPGIVGTRPESVPGPVPYLAADPHLVEAWSKRIAANEDGANTARRRVGLVWSGSPSHRNDRNRSTSLEQFAPLAGVTDVQFYSLQRGPAAEQATHPPGGLGLLDWSGDFRDMADTAALVACLDLVITVDTAVAHLAGALGKPVWTLLPYAPDWRWMRDRNDTPWYPTMRLFRQPRRGDWMSVLGTVAEVLSDDVRRTIPAQAPH